VYHSTLENMFDDMLDHPGELFIASKSKRCALIMLKGASYLIRGDFSGTPAQCEAEARRILKGVLKQQVP
jgi:hypothetical protein